MQMGNIRVLQKVLVLRYGRSRLTQVPTEQASTGALPG